MTVEAANAALVRKTIVAEHVLASVEKALEVAGGVGFCRSIGLERLLRDGHGAQLHPLSAKRQHRPHFAGARSNCGCSIGRFEHRHEQRAFGNKDYENSVPLVSIASLAAFLAASGDVRFAPIAPERADIVIGSEVPRTEGDDSNLVFNRPSASPCD
jgi:hypothetical protein